MKRLSALLLGFTAITLSAQTNPPFDPLTGGGKFKWHVNNTFGLVSLVETVGAAGAAQIVDTPSAWGRTGEGFGKRIGSIEGATFARNVIGFGIDSALHEDPRYWRSGTGGFWPRMGHVVKETITTHNDEGGRAVSIWRIGSAYGAGYISALWYPNPPSAAKNGFENGSIILAVDVLTNTFDEFWPDIRKKIRGH